MKTTFPLEAPTNSYSKEYIKYIKDRHKNTK